MMAILFPLFSTQVTQSPVDLYLIIDQSDSIRPKMYESILLFGQDVSLRLAEIIGFYTPDLNGLRVNLITFGCGDGQSKARIRQSSDEEYIKRKIGSIIENVQPHEETCLERTLQITQEMIDESSDFEPPSRYHPIVVLTDGRFDDFDEFSTDELIDLKNVDQTQFYSIGVGDKVRVSQVQEIAGDEERYLHVDDPDALETLIELILAFIQSDFNIFDATIIYSESSEEVDFSNEENYPLLGELLSVRLSGSNVENLQSSDNLMCYFSFSDGSSIDTGGSLRTRNGENVVECTYPEFLSYENQASVRLYANDVLMGSQVITVYRQVGNVEFSADPSNTGLGFTFDICYGDVEGTVSLSGQSITYIRDYFASPEHDVQAKVNCRFGYESRLGGGTQEVTQEATFSGNSLQCPVPEDIFSVPLEDDLFKVEMLVSYEQSEQLIAASEPQVSFDFSARCFEYEVRNQESQISNFCFGDWFTFTVSGRSIDTLLSQSQDGVVSIDDCIFRRENTYFTKEYTTSANSLSCALPIDAGIVENPVDSVTINFHYTSDSDIEQSFEIPLDLEVSTCAQGNVEILRFGQDESNEFCAGDDLSISFTGEGIENIPEFLDIVSGVRATCTFKKRNEEGEEYFLYETFPVVNNGDYECVAIEWNPWTTPENLYYGYSSVSLALNNSGYQRVSRELTRELQPFNQNENSLCFEVSGHGVDDSLAPLTLQGDNLMKNRDLQDDDSCWPECCQRSSVEIDFAGTSTQYTTQDMPEGAVIKCYYTPADGGSIVETNAVITGEFPETRLECEPAPGWTYTNGGGDYLSVRMQTEFDGIITVLTTHIYEPSSASQACINYIYPDTPCLGEDVVIIINGLTIDALFQDAGIDPSEDFSVLVAPNTPGSEETSLLVSSAASTISAYWGSWDTEIEFEDYILEFLIEQTQYQTEQLETISVETCEEPATGGGGVTGGDIWWIILLFIALLVIAILLVLFVKRRIVPSAGEDRIYIVDDRVEVKLQKENLPKDSVNEDETDALYWVKGTVTRVDVVDKRTDEEKKESDEDLEAGKGVKGVLHFYAIKFDNPKVDPKTNVESKDMRMALTDFKENDHVKASIPAARTEFILGNIKEVKFNDEYVVMPEDGEEFVTNGALIVLLKPLLFEVGDQVFAKPSEDKETAYLSEVVEASLINQEYKIRILDESYPFFKIKTEYKIEVTRVEKFEFAVGEVVQVQDTESKASWRRATIKQKHGSGSTKSRDMTYDVEYSYESLPNESKVIASRIRRPIFYKQDKVEVFDKEEVKPEQWQPGVIREAKKDGKNFDVFLTKKEKVQTVEAQDLRHQDMGEVLLRVRKGEPLRQQNFESTPDAGEGLVPRAMRFKRKKPIEYTELPEEQFDIAVEAKQGLGIQFGWTEDKKIIVSGFRDLENGDWGPLEATGLVMLRDQLIKVDKKMVAGYGIGDLTQLLDKAKAQEKVTLRFGRYQESDEEEQLAET
eukprot:augustus_masked-scaffold_6-processed-gene-3.6-mRNA-1 protein AED:1.00 eAED:1.00 QI:0/-1/0/0/-1/1/1/0/1475